MIFLWIILAVIMILLFLLSLRVYLIFDYHEKPSVTLRVLCFRFDGVHLIKQFLTKDKAAVTSTGESNESLKKSKNPSSGDFAGFIEFLFHVADVLQSALRDFFSKAKVNLKELYVLIGTDDAAETAMLSGAVMHAANGVFAALQHFSNFRCRSNHITISPNFSSSESKLSFHLVLSSTICHLIFVYLRANMRFFD